MANSTRSDWAAVVTGAESDIEDWLYVLEHPFDPWVEKHKGLRQNEVLLRSSEFAGFADHIAVRERALTMVVQLNGAVWTLYRSGRVDFLAVVELFSDGRLGHFLSAHMTGRVKFRAKFGNGPSETLPQQWHRLALSTPMVADMLGHLSGNASWYDLYKAFEDARAICAAQPDLRKLPWYPSGPEASLFTQTANYFFRHGLAGRNAPPKKPMTRDEAEALIHRLVDGILRELARGLPRVGITS